MGLVFLSYFRKDKDKIKLMFSIAFFIGATSQLMILLKISEISTLSYAIYNWTGLSVTFAVFLVINQHFLKLKQKKSIFNIFLIILAISSIITIIPSLISNFTFIFQIIMMILASEIIIACVYQIIKEKSFSSTMFLFALISFTIGGISQSYGHSGLYIFGFFVGNIFIIQIFFSEMKLFKSSSKGFGSYFSLEQKLQKTQEKLRKSEGKIKALLSNAPNIIMMVDRNGTIKYINQTVPGFSIEETIGKKVSEYTLPEYQKLETDAIKKAFENKEMTSYEVKGVGANGQEAWYETRVAPMIIDDKVENAVMITSDITFRKNAENKINEKVHYLEDTEIATLNIMEDFQDTINALKSAEKEIKELNKNLENKVEQRTNEVQNLLKQKEDFINHLSHDLKTPLTPLTTLLPIVKKNIKNEKLEKMLDISIKNSEYLKNLVLKTLLLERVNAIEKDIDLVELNLKNEINQILEKKGYVNSKYEYKINNDINSSLNVYADLQLFEELIDNLISNAINYKKQDTNVEININAEQKNDETIIKIKDNGIGMTNDQIEQIFDEFYKADPSRHNLKSTGLGLTICKKIVEKHDGKIWAKSEGPGKGSEFFFSIKSK